MSVGDAAMIFEPFDDRSHNIVRDVLDYAEQRYVREGRCRDAEAVDYLTLDYFATYRDFMQHAAQYVENEEFIAADLFLAKLPRGRLKQRLDRNHKACARQLANRTRIYFPNYEPLLRMALLHVLRSEADAEAIRWNGVVLLASATLPGVLTDVRRELRRRGMPYDVTLVADATAKRRIGTRAMPALSLLD